MLTDAETKNMPAMLFHALHRAHRNMVQAELHARGLSGLGSPMILLILANHGDHGEIASQRQLAQALGVSAAAIATSLKSLERMGYVEKRPDGRDSRRNRVAITPKGEDAVAQCFEVFEQIDQRMLSGLTCAERADLNRLHRRLLGNLGVGKHSEQGGCCPCCED